MENPDKCANCDKQAAHKHHIVPKSLGGTDQLSNLVDLCESCHGLVHDRAFTNHKELTRLGLEKAKARGVKLGAFNKEGEFVGRKGTVEDVTKARDAHVAKANAKAADLAPLLASMADLSHSEVARRLNATGILSPRGKAGSWYPNSVSLLRKRLEKTYGKA